MRLAKKNKRMILGIGCLVLFFAAFLSFFARVSAYELLEPLPSRPGNIMEVGGNTFGAGGSTDFAGYLTWFFNFGLVAAAFLATVQIVIAGLQWVTSGATSESILKDARGRIEDAIWGLVLAFGAWLLLYTINPDLVTTSFNLPDIPQTPSQTVQAPVGYSGTLNGEFYFWLEDSRKNCQNYNRFAENSSLCESLLAPHPPGWSLCCVKDVATYRWDDGVCHIGAKQITVDNCGAPPAPALANGVCCRIFSGN